MGGLIHVGAWDGREYRHLRNADRKVMLFEPQVAPFAELERTYDDYENFELHHCALGTQEGEVTMHTALKTHSSSLLEPRLGCEGFAGTETVRITTLDSVMAGRNGYDTLIVDTQGYELEVLRGAEKTLEQINRVECEVHDPMTYPGAASVEAIDDYLTAHGFVQTSIVSPGLDNVTPDVVYEKP